jgi:hypothetical protein
MKLILALAIAAGTIASIADTARPQTPAWCALLDGDEQQCNYNTQQECLATVSAVGGVCTMNPAAAAPQAMPAQPSSENAQGLLQLQQQDPGLPPGLGGFAGQGPPNN